MAKRFAVLSDSLKVAFEFFSEELKLQYKPDGYRYYLTFEDTPLDLFVFSFFFFLFAQFTISDLLDAFQHTACGCLV